MDRDAKVNYVGQEIRIHELKSRSELNGEHATVEEELANGRLKVRLHVSNTCISISKDNVIIVVDSSAVKICDEEDKGVVSLSSPVTLSMNPNPPTWSTKSYFYPFGNTPAKSLIDHSPTHLEKIRVLLLGCGDPRHVLYSVFTAQKAGGLVAKQDLAFVLCDISASILARNILLFRLIFDGVKPYVIWSLFYSKIVSKVCIKQMADTAASLLALGETLTEWHASDFGAVIRFCDENTLQTVRKIWVAYSRGALTDKKKIATFKKQQLEEITERNKTWEEVMGLTAVRQTLPIITSALKNRESHSHLVKDYIRVGRTPTCIHRPPMSARAEDYCNPLMLEGPEQEISFHYALDPTLCFQLAAAYLPLLNEGHTTASSSAVDSDNIYKKCFSQFSDWCSGFAAKLSLSVSGDGGDKGNNGNKGNNKGTMKIQGTMKIHSYVGDAIDCCQAITLLKEYQHQKSTGKVVPNLSPFLLSLTCRPACFDDQVPVEYDYIDTSNIGDSIGLINVLCACRNLMVTELHSVLSTDILSTALEDRPGRIDLDLQELLRCDLTTFTAITGLTLSESVLSATSNFHYIGGALHGTSKSMTLAWRLIVPEKDMRVDLGSTDFVKIFMSIYARMFQNQLDTMSMLSERGIKHMITQNQGQNRFATPTTQTFARLVCIAKNNLHGIDAATIMTLVNAIRDSRYLVQGQYIQTTYVWFALLRLLPSTALDNMNREVLTQYPRSDAHCRQFITKPGALPPSLVLLTLLVLRQEMDVIAPLHSVVLDMSIESTGGNSQCFFESFHTFFVKERIQGQPSEKDLEERGIGSRIMRANSFSLVEGTEADYTYVACSVIVTLACVAVASLDHIMLALRVGKASTVDTMRSAPHLSFQPISSAMLADASRVSWCAYTAHTHRHMLPQVNSTALRLSDCVTPSVSSTIQGTQGTGNVKVTPCKAQCSTHTALSLGCMDVKADAAIEVVDSYSVTVTFESPQCMVECQPTLSDRPHPMQLRLRMGFSTSTTSHTSYDLALPAAIDISKAKIQISRKRGFVTILLPVAKKSDVSRRLTYMYRSTSSFPPSPSSPPSPSNTLPLYSLFGVTRVFFGSMLKIDPQSSTQRGYEDLYLLASAQLHLSEREGNKGGNKETKTALVSMKETIHSLILNFLAYKNNNQPRTRLFGFASESSGIEIIVFVNSLRLDPSQGTIVIDAAVCVLDMKVNLDTVARWYQNEVEEGKSAHWTPPTTVCVSASEVVLWKRMLPALCERTRNDWCHAACCEYIYPPQSKSTSKKGKKKSSGGGGAGVGGAADSSSRVTEDLIPRSCDTMGTAVLCHCGQGKGLGGSEFEEYLGGSGHPLLSHFSRVAISPLFTPFMPMFWEGES